MTLRYLAFVALICAGQGATAQDAQENPFDLPVEQPSLGDVSSATERDSLTNIAGDTAVDRELARLSAEDQAAIEAYRDFLETGRMNPAVEVSLNDLIDRYRNGDIPQDHPLAHTLAEIVANQEIIEILQTEENIQATLACGGTI